ncbi:MAG: efflux transporter outer membrane subunit [Alphaproteobacteria bacterium]
MHSFKFHASLLVAALLTACTVGEDYKIPEYYVGVEWDAFHEEWHQFPKPEYKAAHTERWWTWFADGTLNQLVNQAIERNHDLKSAQARIKEARANERITGSVFFPQGEGVATGRRGTLGGFAGDTLDNSKQYGVSGSWEIDLFGGNRRRDEAAHYNVMAANASMQQVRLVLISDVARNYVRLRGLQKQLELTNSNLGLQSDAQEVTQGRRDENMVSQLDVVRARAQTQTTKARIPQIKAEINAVANRLAVLTASNPKAIREFVSSAAPIPAMPESLPMNIPIETIRSRPDVRTAERQLAEATALSGAAFAEFFPKISLEGFFGRNFSDVYGNLSPWNVTLNSLLPILHFDRISAGVDAAEARQEQAYHNFQQAVLLAVEDVEVNLYNYLSEQERLVSLNAVARAQRDAATIAREQYGSGIASQLDLLDAQRGALDAETQQVTSETLIAENLVLLLTALSDGHHKEDDNQPELTGDKEVYSYPSGSSVRSE